MKKITIFLVLTCIVSCKKADRTAPYSFVHVKFTEDEDYTFMETTDGAWNKNSKIAQLTATGYKNERFKLFLANLTDTGYYPGLSAANIFYTDGADFISFRLNSGFIHVGYIDSISVKGNFQVSLASNFNSYVNRTITGDFGINFP
ncbi:hypothetical protein [Ferruginibacter profundus]